MHIRRFGDKALDVVIAGLGTECRRLLSGAEMVKLGDAQLLRSEVGVGRRT